MSFLTTSDWSKVDNSWNKYFSLHQYLIIIIGTTYMSRVFQNSVNSKNNHCIYLSSLLLCYEGWYNSGLQYFLCLLCIFSPFKSDYAMSWDIIQPVENILYDCREMWGSSTFNRIILQSSIWTIFALTDYLIYRFYCFHTRHESFITVLYSCKN